MRSRPSNLVIVAALCAASLLLWNSVLLYPLQLLVVLMHETAHGLAALATGGSVVRVEVHALQGGLTCTVGGKRFIILSAGYLGSSLIGAFILWSASHRTMGKYIAEIVGVLILVETAFWVRDLFTFGFAVAMGGFCIILGWKIRGVFETIFMQWLGSVSCLYAIFDIFDDILRKTFARGTAAVKNDAQALAEITGLPAVLWGVVWIVVAAAVFLGTVRNLPKRPPDKTDERYCRPN
ncbi:MAG: M50 family metallopeptidase [Kiritimatiellae bacterium]|nr:M50 family metallopeptidase [Kiritimatiellia bacterium]